MSASSRPPLLLALVIALPLAAIVGGIWTAIRASGPLDASPDDVRRTAQIQTVDDRADQLARSRGIHGDAALSQGQIVVTLNVAPGGPLAFALIHATDAKQDRSATLAPCGTHRYCADLAWPDARFQLSLRDETAGWRIVGQRELGQDAVALAPAWSEP